MDGGNLQRKIQYGYSKCAQKIGAPFLLYRSTSPINPISGNNLIGVIDSSANVSWDYMKTQKFGNAVWNLIINTDQNTILYAQVGDYLIPTIGYYLENGAYNSPINGGYCYQGSYGTDNILEHGFIEDIDMYYIGATEFLLPPLGIKCNSVISIIRPSQVIGAGYQGYAEYLPDTASTIMSNMPASVLEVGVSGKAETKLPTDTDMPRWRILIPNLGGVFIRIDDIIIDEFNQEYVVTDNELTFLGWRILADQIVNSR